MKITDLFEGTDTRVQSIRELVGSSPPVESSQTEYDARATARLPGDEVKDHVGHTEPNPFILKPPSETKAAIQSGELSREEERQARTALRYLQLQQSDATHEGGGFHPPLGGGFRLPEEE